MVQDSGRMKTESLNTEPINFISDNEVEDGNDDTLLDISYKDDIDTIQHVNDIIDNNILIRKTFLLPQGEDGEVICAQVKARDAEFNLKQEMFLISLCEGQDTEGMMYNVIITIIDTLLQREFKLQ